MDDKIDRLPFGKNTEHTSHASIVCGLCAHLSKTKHRQCKAFEHIPDEIWEGDNYHTSPFPGDHGVLFELADRWKKKAPPG